MNANILIYTLILSFLVTQVSYAQRTFSSNPEREIIVHFNDNVLNHKQGASSGLLENYTISSRVLQRSLDSARVEFIGKLIPSFKKEDRFIQSRQGKQVTLSDWSSTMILRIPENGSREKLIKILEQLPEVAYAEINGLSESEVIKSYKPYDRNTENNHIKSMLSVTPNDEYFNRQWALKNTGSLLQGSGTPDADIDADQAWDITAGNSSVAVGVIGQGIDRNHEDLSGKIAGDNWGSSGHETAIAGIIAAKGNNTIGISGVAYNTQLIDAFTWNGSLSEVSSAIIGASNYGAQILNYSYKLSNGHSNTVRRAIRDVYELNRVFITTMGNDESTSKQYPAAYKDGVISVGATTNTDVRASYSNKGDWIDVVAPGGSGSSGSGAAIFTTIYGSSAVNG